MPARRGRGRKLVFLSLFLLTIAGWFYLFLGSAYFKISRIEAKGDSEMNGAVSRATELIASEWKLGLIPQSNLFLFPAKEAEERLKEKLLLQSIKIEKVYPNALVVSFDARTPSLTLNSGRFSYVLDAAGVVIKKDEIIAEATSTAPGLIGARFSELPVVYDDNEKDYKISDDALSGNLVGFIRTVDDALSRELNIEAAKFSFLPESPSTLVVKTNKNFELFLNIRTDGQEQISRLKLVLGNKSPEEISSFKYVDLRFGDRIFSK